MITPLINDNEVGEQRKMKMPHCRNHVNYEAQ